MATHTMANSIHVVFSAECNAAMDWQSVGLFHSFKTSGRVGNITRLLACSDEQMRTYEGMDAGPTFVHHNMRFGHPLIDEIGYPSYNKPASVMFFLEHVDVKEEYIALLDADMLLREPLDPAALGAAPGVVVSAEYSYLVGTSTANATHDHCFARRFLTPEELPLMVRCGGFHIFHREDIRRIAPLWVDFTRQVRAFAKAEPETFYAESFLNWDRTPDPAAGPVEAQWATRRKQALWQAEMYGYIFGAARAGVSHVVRKDTMLYPGYNPLGGLLPTILHYGADYTIVGDEDAVTAAASPAEPPSSAAPPQQTVPPPGGWDAWFTAHPAAPSVYFNKMNQVGLDVYALARRKGCEMTPLDIEGQPLDAQVLTRPRRPPVAAPSFEAMLGGEHSSAATDGFFFFAQPPPVRFADGRVRRPAFGRPAFGPAFAPLCTACQQLRTSSPTFGLPARSPSLSCALPMQPRSKRDLLCIEHLHMLNDALCHFYAARCGEPSAWQCPDRARAPELAHALRECHDTHSLCGQHSLSGECERNPVWMLAECAASCGLCGVLGQVSSEVRELLVQVLVPYELTGPLAHEPPAKVALAEILTGDERVQEESDEQCGLGEDAAEEVKEEAVSADEAEPQQVETATSSEIGGEAACDPPAD